MIIRHLKDFTNDLATFQSEEMIKSTNPFLKIIPYRSILKNTSHSLNHIF
ncbi:17536_t:CDS:1, partial [Cetraspora pellucida]